MTLEEFTLLRRDELIAFFKARFGRRWRAMVTRQAGEHPRAFDRWRTRMPPFSLYRLINRLDKWARTIGFESATDDRVEARLRAYQAFQKAAAQQVESEQQKRNERYSACEGLDGDEIRARMAAAFRRMREASPENAGR